MPQLQKEIDRKELEKRLPHMPWYVDKFINYKLPDLSPSTLLAYIRDYETFFNLLLAEGLAPTGEMSQIPIETLETLPLDAITGYKAFLKTKMDQPNSRTTISIKISSLRSLFHYLSQLAEDENFYPLLKRNVMAKVKVYREKKPRKQRKP